MVDRNDDSLPVSLGGQEWFRCSLVYSTQGGAVSRAGTDRHRKDSGQTAEEKYRQKGSTEMGFDSAIFSDTF